MYGCTQTWPKAIFYSRLYIFSLPYYTVFKVSFFFHEIRHRQKIFVIRANLGTRSASACPENAWGLKTTKWGAVLS